jgi:NAD(P)-dependent dehydrogenase (short-subunit alcohol dehydrogenase family)
MRVLAMRGAHVLCAARTLEKAEEACAGIRGRTTPVVIELTDFPSIVSGTDAVRAMGMPIDMLILNAGIMALPELEQVNGLEKQFVTNHLGHFIVGNRLLPQVQAAAQGRVVVLSSSGYQWAPDVGIEFDNLSGERGYEPNKMYGQSKLANHLYARELAKVLAGSTATANSVHPGVIMTNLGRSFPEWKQTAARLIGWTFMKSVEAGTATTCYVATAPALATVSGCYFADCNPESPGGNMENDALAAKLWAVSEDLTRPYLLAPVPVSGIV